MERTERIIETSGGAFEAAFFPDPGQGCPKGTLAMKQLSGKPLTQHEWMRFANGACRMFERAGFGIVEVRFEVKEQTDER